MGITTIELTVGLSGDINTPYAIEVGSYSGDNDCIDLPITNPCRIVARRGAVAVVAMTIDDEVIIIAVGPSDRD